MNRRRVTLAVAVAATAATATLLGGVLSESRGASPSAPQPERTSGERPFAGITEQSVTQLQERLRKRPGDADSYAKLGFAYQQRARETGDPSYYPRAAAVFRQALSIAPSNALATSGVAAVALSQHRFRDALGLARKAQSVAPNDVRNFGLLGDSLVELGRYEAAFRAYNRMSSLKPNLASYARISYGRELLGRQEAAVAAMSLAVHEAGARAEPAAWTHVQLGKLHFGRGELHSARREFRLALVALPGYVYAFDALARVEAALGHHGRAIGLARRAAETVPLPEFVITLGDLYWATGRKDLAREQYAVVRATERLLRANGVKTELEIALFRVDHGIDLARGLSLARSAYRERPTIFADDTLAWALARNGRCEEALRHSKRALRLGTREASFFFHRGMIEQCLGRAAEARGWFARALRQNPHFSLVWAPVARKALG